MTETCLKQILSSIIPFNIHNLNIRYFLLSGLITIISLQLNCQDRFNIVIPDAQNETEYVWRTLEDIKFFEEHNYHVTLPKRVLIDELKTKSKKEMLSDTDYQNLEKFMFDSVYNREDYKLGYEKIEKEISILNEMVNQIPVSSYDWNFKEFEKYRVNLTLYGPGGSYNPDEGSILIFTTPEGGFKNYENPANTIIHEIVHIGIEQSIISKYGVPHSLKERIVDIFVSLNFRQYLPEYQIQDMGDRSIDPYLEEVSDLKDLERIIKELIP